ncbi:MAG: DNA repair protein RadC [Bacteroidales bacterium]|jgi:DNA repair protein RadC|nr:DNA repair protein RadC [Bacteroidales bacterium]
MTSKDSIPTTKQNDIERKLSITDWAPSARPREKYLANGFNALSDAELIAIILRDGSTRDTAVELGLKLLRMNHNSLNLLAEMSLEDLMSVYGIGKAKAIALKAAFELGFRCRAEKITRKTKIDSVLPVIELMQVKIAHLDHEEFWALYLNQALLLIDMEQLSKGGLTSASVDSRLLVKQALLYNATGVILCHNHPSGSVRPSKEDQFLTLQFKKALTMMNIRLIDHIILSRDAYYSFASENEPSIAR